MPPRCAACGATAAVHTEPPVSAIAAGLLPVVDRLDRRAGRRGSTRDDGALLTAGDPHAPAAGGDRGRLAADADRPDTAFVAGSIRDSVPSWRLTTHTAPSPTASALGPLPTLIARTTAPVRGSMRVTVPASSLATQSAPAPAAIALGIAPIGIGGCAGAVEVDPVHAPSTPDADPQRARGDGQRARRVADRDPLQDLVRAGVDLGDLAARRRRRPTTSPAPKARPDGAPPTGIVTDLVALAVDPRDGAVEPVGDPHRAAAGRDRARAAGRRGTAP